MQKQLEKGKLLDSEGNLEQAGYATSLVKEYDRKAIRGEKLRIKEWDYYLIYNQHFGVALTVDDNSYMGLMSISFLDFDKKTEKNCESYDGDAYGKNKASFQFFPGDHPISG